MPPALTVSSKWPSVSFPPFPCLGADRRGGEGPVAPLHTASLQYQLHFCGDKQLADRLPCHTTSHHIRAPRHCTGPLLPSPLVPSPQLPIFPSPLPSFVFVCVSLLLCRPLPSSPLGLPGHLPISTLLLRSGFMCESSRGVGLSHSPRPSSPHSWWCMRRRRRRLGTFFSLTNVIF